jgi:ABC-2 type transport system ATP-binding protein
VLFLDEPTAGLDPVSSREVQNLITSLGRSGVTIFLTTHRLEEAERVCDRVAILNTRLRSIGRPEELRDRLFSRSLVVVTAAPLDAPEQLFGSVPGIESWRSREPARYALAVSDPAATAPELTRALVHAGADVLSISEAHHSLEDVYLEMVDEREPAARDTT